MKYSIRYNLRGHVKDTDHRYIGIRLSWAGKRMEMLSGFQVAERYWDNEEQRVRSAYRNANTTGASINKELASISSHIDQFFAKCQVEEHIPSLTEVSNLLKQYFGTAKSQQNDLTVNEAIDIFIDSIGEQNAWSDGTYTKYRTIKRHLYNFSPSLSFDDLTEENLQLFMRHLMKEGLRNVTIAKDLDILRGFLRWAYKHGYSHNNDFETFRPKLKGIDGNAKEVIYLEWDELIKLYEYDFGEKHNGLSQVRDVFCFCCFTGLRYSDVAKLKTSDIKDNFISVVTQKTTDGLRIELNDFSRAILNKYTLFQQARMNRRHRALPVISNQKMNAYLKDIGRIIGLDTPIRIVYYAGSRRIENVFPKYELLTTHCARRTFVVNALRLGIPAEVIMKWTGHSDFKSMKPYVKIVDELKMQEMEKFNTLKTGK